jgi:hypothetical protein
MIEISVIMETNVRLGRKYRSANASSNGSFIQRATGYPMAKQRERLKPNTLPPGQLPCRLAKRRAHSWLSNPLHHG